MLDFLREHTIPEKPAIRKHKQLQNPAPNRNPQISGATDTIANIKVINPVKVWTTPNINAFS